MFGFGKGKIDIKIPKFNFKEGETIEGEVILEIKKATKAKGVKIGLLGIETTRTSSFGARSRSRTNILFNFEQPLDGEKEYFPSGPQTYKFKIDIPTGLDKKLDLENEGLNKAMEFASMFSGRSKSVKWLLKAKLDVPMGFDVSKDLQINITE